MIFDPNPAQSLAPGLYPSTPSGASVKFDELTDWTKRPEPGIRNYSGKAVYRTEFDCADVSRDLVRYLDLGTVNVMASVKLNGKDLGIVWCDPWRVEIPKGLLKAKGNKLEITVANLWCLRRNA